MSNSEVVWTILGAMAAQTALIISVLLLVMDAKIATVNERISGLRREMLAARGTPETEPNGASK